MIVTKTVTEPQPVTFITSDIHPPYIIIRQFGMSQDIQNDPSFMQNDIVLMVLWANWYLLDNLP